MRVASAFCALRDACCLRRCVVGAVFGFILYVCIEGDCIRVMCALRSYPAHAQIIKMKFLEKLEVLKNKSITQVHSCSTSL